MDFFKTLLPNAPPFSGECKQDYIGSRGSNPRRVENARHLVVLVAHLFGIAADAVGITFPKTVMRVQIAPLPPKRSVV